MNQEKGSLSEFIVGLPKAELHLHLEGSITLDIWHQLIHRNQIESLIESSLEELRERFSFDSFYDFLILYKDIISSIQTPQDFYEITLLFLKNLSSQGICYAEVFFTPYFFLRNGIDFYDMMSEISRAAKEAYVNWNVEMKLLFDGPRNFGLEVVQEVFQLAVNDRTNLVIGVGIGGDEANFPPALYESAFRFAEANGFYRVAHAGETAGVESMMDAITILKVSRLGHCLGIPKDSRLEELIFENEVTLDLCPWSNVATRVIPEIEAHPFIDYFTRGLPITLNSDDPGIFQTDLIKEYSTMMSLHGLTYQDMERISLNAVQGSFLDSGQKYSLKKKIQEYVKHWVE